LADLVEVGFFPDGLRIEVDSRPQTFLR